MKLRSVKMTKFPLKIVDETLKRWFYRLGVCIGKNPGYFIIIPLLLTALCATGFQQMDYNWDPEYLLSPSTGKAKLERVEMEKHFPIDYKFFQPARMSRVGKFGRIIITAEDGGSLLRSSVWDEILVLDAGITNMTVPHEGAMVSYSQICAKWDGYCKSNDVLSMGTFMEDIESGAFNLSYPITFDPFTFQQYNLPAYFGGVEYDDFGVVTEVKAVALNYFLDVSEDWLLVVGDSWERMFLEEIDRILEISPNVKVAKFCSSTPAWEMEKSKNSITPNLMINVIIMIMFCLAASTMSDAVRSKPLIGLLGLVTACLATGAGFGLLCYCGVEFIALCLAAPFLLLGIGIDDTFVMLSAWVRSSKQASVPERMGQAFSDAAVSITVTSLTDFLSFIAGVITPFPVVRIFCLYTGCAVAFIYVWHLTLFGGCLALAGYAEQKNKHGMFCFTVTPKSLALNRNWFYRVFCTGGVNPMDPYNPIDNKEHAGMAFLRDKLGYALSLKWVKSLVLIIFTAYIMTSIWGITMIQEGLEKRNTVNYDSYSINYYDADDQFYREYRFPINVILSGDIKFSDVSTQQKINRMLKSFENSSMIAPELTTSWLREFLGFVERNEGFDDIDVSIGTEPEFINTLRTHYLADSSSPLRLDVEFSPLGDRISAGRFLLQGHNVVNALDETAMVEELRAVAEQFSDENMKVTVFHPYFIYIDQYLEIMPQTIQSILVTSGFMMIISFIMIPNPLCSLWVAFSILSIEAGVLGFMAWWGINLDGIALINLIMCIGFSVDFSAHICYHYMSEEGKSPDQRIAASLYALGLPIIQGATSTILGVIGLAFAPSYLYVTFFKMIFLVIFLGALHGLILLPVLLSLFGPGSCNSRSSTHSTTSSPSTTVSVHSISSHPRYSVNLGFVTPDPARRKDSSQLPVEHFQRRHVGSPNLRDFKQSEFNPDRFSFITRISEETVASSTTRIQTDPRLTPVPESDEQYDSIIAQLGQRRPPPSSSTRELRHPALSRKRSSSSGDTSPQMPAQGLRLKGASQPIMNMEHKKICRSKSHKPRTTTISDKQLLRELNPKQPLRKYHSFPYHMFNNEGGYSSDESAKSMNEDLR